MPPSMTIFIVMLMLSAAVCYPADEDKQKEELELEVENSEKFFFTDKCKAAREKMHADKKTFSWFHKECGDKNVFNNKQGNLPIPSNPPILRDIEMDLQPLKPVISKRRKH
ncbi:uncharacterized protein LOC143914718 [Arctopsyche grandis]|uniref:uncharacterized protein LOC143914718 n=1 Tax=Arctopsyche grandis TaxID=121162 RepID=UPI00406D6D85